VAGESDAAVVELITGFLDDIGIAIRRRELGDECFLPGIRLAGGALEVDEAKLSYPGDLLHEAGHLAVVPVAVRRRLTGSLDGLGLDLAELEVAAIPWSYAAAVHLGLDPAVVFHEGGYRGRSAGLLATFAAGVAPGLHLLEAADLAAGPRRASALGVPPYPHMLRWLRA
jgi:hypothetical protein